MPTRIAFSTHYPDRMKELAGKPTRFPEKLITMIDPGGQSKEVNDIIYSIEKSGVHNFNFKVNYSPKTTTIRSNYDYWKSKEGQLIQPFFWAGKPRRSKQVVFCPEVRLKAVKKIEIHNYRDIQNHKFILDTIRVDGWWLTPRRIEELIQNEGFDHPDHFWRWFDKDFNGCLLEFKAVGG